MPRIEKYKLGEYRLGGGEGGVVVGSKIPIDRFKPYGQPAYMRSFAVNNTTVRPVADAMFIDGKRNLWIIIIFSTVYIIDRNTGIILRSSSGVVTAPYAVAYDPVTAYLFLDNQSGDNSGRGTRINVMNAQVVPWSVTPADNLRFGPTIKIIPTGDGGAYFFKENTKLYRVDNAGNLLLEKTYPSYCTYLGAADRDPSGNILIVGSNSNTTNADISAAILNAQGDVLRTPQTLVSGQGYYTDTFYAKLDSKGDAYIFFRNRGAGYYRVQKFQGNLNGLPPLHTYYSDPTQEVFSIDVSLDGHLIMSRRRTESLGGYSASTEKYDASYTRTWVINPWIYQVTASYSGHVKFEVNSEYGGDGLDFSSTSGGARDQFSIYRQLLTVTQ